MFSHGNEALILKRVCFFTFFHYQPKFKLIIEASRYVIYTLTPWWLRFETMTFCHAGFQYPNSIKST